MASLIQFIALVINIGLIVYAISTWFLSPYHPLRATLANIFEPFLSPIRRLIPPIAGFDFSIYILLVIIWILENILFRILP